MNIFYVDPDPCAAAAALPDKHVVKMPVEAVQMLVSVCQRHGLPNYVTTKAGTPHRGGYAKHPCTLWAGETQSNASWLLAWGRALCEEYTRRYGKHHFAEQQLEQVERVLWAVPDGELTPPALAMPDECKTDDPVESYRNCIRAKVAEKPDSFVWRKGRPAPSWIA